MIIPNYCGYPCANYFAYNERSVGYFNLDKVLMDKYMNAKKRFIVVSNTEGTNIENALTQQSAEPKIQASYLCLLYISVLHNYHNNSGYIQLSLYNFPVYEH